MRAIQGGRPKQPLALFMLRGQHACVVADGAQAPREQSSVPPYHERVPPSAHGPVVRAVVGSWLLVISSIGSAPPLPLPPLPLSALRTSKAPIDASEPSFDHCQKLLRAGTRLRSARTGTNQPLRPTYPSMPRSK